MEGDGDEGNQDDEDEEAVEIIGAQNNAEEAVEFIGAQINARRVSMKKCSSQMHALTNKNKNTDLNEIRCNILANSSTPFTNY